MGVKKIITEYLNEAHAMQLATFSGDRPWCCTLFFAVDDQYNLYWISRPESRHSREIADNPSVAGAIARPQTYDDKDRLCGLQFEGTAREVTDTEEIRRLAHAYAARYNRDTVGEDIANGSIPHHLYQIKPTLFQLFDRAHFGDDTQIWRLED